MCLTSLTQSAFIHHGSLVRVALRSEEGVPQHTAAGLGGVKELTPEQCASALRRSAAGNNGRSELFSGKEAAHERLVGTQLSLHCDCIGGKGFQTSVPSTTCFYRAVCVSVAC